MLPPVRSVPPPDAAGVGHGRRRPSSPTAWTGEKRRKTVGAPSPPLGLGSSSSDSDDATEAMLVDDGNRSLVQEDDQREEEFVFSAEDVIGLEERIRCFQVLKARELGACLPSLSQLDSEDRDKLFEHLARLRYREFKLLKEGALYLDDTTDTVPVSELPDEVWDWESPYKPGLGMFGWTFDTTYFDFAKLDDYRRIVLKFAHYEEYHNWNAYRRTFSSYEADEEYVKYWGKLFKKIKWIEGYLHLDREEFAMYKTRGSIQAMKIAASFCHLPASLAVLGYEEYICVLQDDYEFRKDYDRVYLGLWKRVVKQRMDFEEALKDILTSDNTLPSKCFNRIKSTIEGDDAQIYLDFLRCREHVAHRIFDGDDDDTILEIINDVLDTKIERPKWYVDYAKKKVEVARRIRVLPAGMGRAGEEGSKTAHL